MKTNNKHYRDDKGFKGIWVGDNAGLVVSLNPEYSLEKCHELLKNQPALKILSASPRLIRGEQTGTRIHFVANSAITVKFADAEQVSLIQEITRLSNSFLVLQVKNGNSFTVTMDPDMSLKELSEIKFNPIVISLASTRYNERNKDETWHSNPSFRISAGALWHHNLLKKKMVA